MPAIAPQSAAAATRPLLLRMRNDLVVRPQTVAGRRRWAVKDPIALNYFHLRDEERAILEMLDGRASASEIIDRFERRFAPRRLTHDRLQAFLGRLHSDGLIVSDVPGQFRPLLDRSDKQRHRRWVASAANLLAIRLPGANPSVLLDVLMPVARVAFSPVAVASSLMLIAAAIVLAVTHAAKFAAQLPDIAGFFTARNAIFVLGAISLTKVLHELGHALVCRRFGGECHEIGPMFLVFAPCLYCDVTDSWMFASKWQRAAVALAGIYVEAVLAAAATFVWWFSAPGLFHALAQNVMIVCSVNTLLFNGNPLLRYDGYYVLSDLLEIPNLAEQSTTRLRRLAASLFLGDQTQTAEEQTGWRGPFLITYGLASLAYRLLLSVVLVWCCYRMLIPYRLEGLVVVLALSVVGGLVAGPAYRGLRFVRTPVAGSRVRRGRLLFAITLFAAAGASVLLTPLPVRITAPVVIEPLEARRIYVSEAGQVESAVAAGTHVEAGATIATLSNDELDLEIVRLTGERDRQQTRLDQLLRRRGQNRDAAAEIPTAREALADLEKRLRNRQEDQSRLILQAPIAGTVLPPEWKDARAAHHDLKTWDGTPLLAQNRGAFVETGTLFCLVGDPRQVEAVAVVDQADVERLAVGQRADVKLGQAAGDLLHGTVIEIAEIDLDVAPRQLAYRGGLPATRDALGVARPTTASYQVRVRLEATERAVLLGAPGRVRIHAASESLLVRARRWLRGTFHFAV